MLMHGNYPINLCTHYIPICKIPLTRHFQQCRTNSNFIAIFMAENSTKIFLTFTWLQFLALSINPRLCLCFSPKNSSQLLLTVLVPNNETHYVLTAGLLQLFVSLSLSLCSLSQSLICLFYGKSLEYFVIRSNISIQQQPEIFKFQKVSSSSTLYSYELIPPQGLDGTWALWCALLPWHRTLCVERLENSGFLFVFYSQYLSQCTLLSLYKDSDSAQQYTLAILFIQVWNKISSNIIKLSPSTLVLVL